MITKAQLAQYILSKGCIIFQFPEVNNRGSVIRFKNPKTGTTAFLNSPIDDSVIIKEVAYGICVRLNIPMP
jgi:hypothetical protein